MARTADVEVAFGQAYDHYKGTMRTFARNSAYAIPGYDEEDVVQELTMVLLRCVERYDPDKGARFNSLFQGCCKNHIISLIRRFNTQSRKGTTISLDNDDVAAVVDLALQAFSAEDEALAQMSAMERLATPEGREKAMRPIKLKVA